MNNSDCLNRLAIFEKCVRISRSQIVCANRSVFVFFCRVRRFVFGEKNSNNFIIAVGTLCWYEQDENRYTGSAVRRRFNFTSNHERLKIIVVDKKKPKVDRFKKSTRKNDTITENV